MTHLPLSALGWQRRAAKPFWSLQTMRGYILQLVCQHRVFKDGLDCFQNSACPYGIVA
jgi:hypothetical protein